MIKTTLTLLILLCLPFNGVSQGKLNLEILTEQIRTNFGAGKSLYQAKNGLIWIGANPMGLAYYNGQKFVHVPLEGEEVFATKEEVFVVGDSL